MTDPILRSTSSVFVWNIPMEDWTNAVEDGSINRQFKMPVPPSGRRVMWNLDIFPKGAEGSSFIGVLIGPTIDVEKNKLKIGKDFKNRKITYFKKAIPSKSLNKEITKCKKFTIFMKLIK